MSTGIRGFPLSSSAIVDADAIGMNFVDLAPLSPLLLAELAPVAAARVQPIRNTTESGTTAKTDDRAVQPAIAVHLGDSLDTYI